mgnify:CR=1 FL=1
MSASDLTQFQFQLLAILAERDDAPKGVTVKESLEAHHDTEINHGRLYQNLDQLVEAGFVTKRPRDGRTNAYILTAEGRETLEAELAWFHRQLAAEVPA